MFRSGYTAALPILMAVLLNGCGAVNYDEQADQQLTSITQETNQQFTTWESQAAAKTPVVYDTKFYDKVEADLKTLEIRMEASQDPATQNLVPVFASLIDQIDQLRKLHIAQKTFADVPFLQAESDLLNAQFAALITFELSLKPNAASGSSSPKMKSTSTSTTAAKVPAATTKVQAVMGQ